MTEVIKQRIEHLIDQGFSWLQISEMLSVNLNEVEEVFNNYIRTGKIWAESPVKKR